MLGCVSRFMKTVQRETLRGFRCKLGEDFLTVYPNIEVSVKDHKDKDGNDVIATAVTLASQKANGGSIHIDPSKKGTFTAAATKHGKSVQEFASQVLAHPENYSPAMRKKATFAKNSSKWHRDGGLLDLI